MGLGVLLLFTILAQTCFQFAGESRLLSGQTLHTLANLINMIELASVSLYFTAQFLKV